MAVYSGTQAYGLNPSSLDFSWGNPRGFESHSSQTFLHFEHPVDTGWCVPEQRTCEVEILHCVWMRGGGGGLSRAPRNLFTACCPTDLLPYHIYAFVCHS